MSFLIVAASSVIGPDGSYSRKLKFKKGTKLLSVMNFRDISRRIIIVLSPAQLRKANSARPVFTLAAATFN